jgi:hypothetical protein
MNVMLKLLLGLVSAWPPLFFVIHCSYLMIFFMTRTPEAKLFESTWSHVDLALLFFTGLIALGLLPLYMYHLYTNRRIREGRLGVWAVYLLAGGIIAFPVYWYLYIWNEGGTAGGTTRP